VNDAPKLLVEWSSPWQEFVTAIRPAMGRSGERLAGEARSGLFPYRGMMISWVLEAVILVAVIIVPTRLAQMRPYVPPVLPKYEIIYFSGEELPRAEDAGGAQSGRSGHAGGQEAHHRSQTIRVARGNSLREKVVDAPKLNLPRSDAAVANLLAFKAIPGPAPAEGLKSSARLLAMSPAAVAPAPQIDRDKMQSSPTLDARRSPRIGLAAAAGFACCGDHSAAGLGSGAIFEFKSAAYAAGTDHRRTSAADDSRDCCGTRIRRGRIA